MLIKIIWGFIGLNTLALIVFIGAYFVLNSGKNVDSMESGWTFILSCLGLVVILLAALPLYYGKSGFAVVFAGIFAILPTVIFLYNYLSDKLPSFKAKSTYATTYYEDKTQRSIAAAIEQNDTVTLKQLIKGQNLNIQGTRVNDWDGLNYLQFAIHIRTNPISFPFNDTANTAAIKILVENGSATTPALVDAVLYLPVETLTLLLDAGANPNVKSLYSGESVLFSTIGSSKEQIDKAFLLVKKGADVNAKHSYGLTPVMYVANQARTSPNWQDAWRFAYFLLAEAKADYLYVNKDGTSLQSIIRKIRHDAIAENITMQPEFQSVVDWLKQHKVDTDPVVN